MQKVYFFSNSFKFCFCLLGYPPKKLLIYDAPKLSTVCVVKWQVISHQKKNFQKNLGQLFYRFMQVIKTKLMYLSSFIIDVLTI